MDSQPEAHHKELCEITVCNVVLNHNNNNSNNVFIIKIKVLSKSKFIV